MPRCETRAGEYPLPPDGLSHGDVTLRFVRLFPGNAAQGLVPFYHFQVVNSDGREVGHLNFRVGETRHVVFYAGHIGYEIQKKFRGRRFALQACKAVAPFVRTVCDTVVITCDTDNYASIRTIELLGAKFIEEIPVDPNDPTYVRPNLRKRATVGLIGRHFEEKPAVLRFRKFTLYFAANLQFGHTLYTRVQNAGSLNAIEAVLDAFFAASPELASSLKMNYLQ